SAVRGLARHLQCTPEGKVGLAMGEGECGRAPSSLREAGTHPTSRHYGGVADDAPRFGTAPASVRRRKSLCRLVTSYGRLKRGPGMFRLPLSTHPQLSREPFSRQTLAKASRLRGAAVTESVCPYCAVGCGQLIYTKAGKVIDIEGDPRSPIS